MNRILSFLLLFALVSSCTDKHENVTLKAQQEEEHEHEHHDVVHLSPEQYNAIGMKIGDLPMKNLQGFVETNGELTLPPNSQAAVTTLFGANIGQIKVIEGDRVTKGQTLATIYHPNLIELQTEYVKQILQLEYIEKELKRQKRLLEGSVAAGRDLQEVQTEYSTLKTAVKGLETQLTYLHLDANKLKKGDISEEITIKSPLNGYVRHIAVQVGQYVEPNQILFEIINNDHIHAHFHVFEKDIRQVKEGQLVQFTVESQPEKQHLARIITVGRAFENDLKAIQVHAELENDDELLLPGMYIRGQIQTQEQTTYALPKEAVVMDGERHFLFTVTQEKEDENIEWHFHPLEISTGIQFNNWVEVKLHQPLELGVQFAWNNAYYLLAELKKEEAAHDH